MSTNLDVTFELSADAPVVRVKGTVDLADLAVTDKQDAPLFAAQTLHVNAANLEPLRNVYRLDEVRLTQPDVKLSRDKNGAFNFEKLGASTPASTPAPAAAPAPASDAKPADAAQPLDLAIKHLAIDQGHVVFDDHLMAQSATLGLTALNVTLDDFSTLGKPPARYTLKTAFDNGGGLDVSGNFTLPGKNADAKLALNDLPLAPLQPYVANAVAARVTDGSLGANLPLQVDWSKPEPSVQVGTGDVTLKSLKLVPQSNNTAPIALGSAQAKIRKIDVAARTAALDSVVLNGLSIDAKRLKDGSIDLAALAGPHETAPEASATRKVEKANAAGPAWRYQIAQVSLNDSSANFTDESTQRPVNLHIAPLQLNVKQVTDDLTKPLAIDGKLTMNGKGALAVAGTLTAKPLSLALHVDANALDASAFEPYFGSNLNATVSSALLSANGDASFSGEGRALKAGYKGDVSLSNVRLIDRVNSDQLAGWKLLGLTKLNARYDERGADVEAARITFANFYGRVLLDAQGKLNLTDIVAKDKGTGTTQAGGRCARCKACSRAAATNTAASTANAPKTASSLANLRFGQLVLQNGRVTYTDNFIKPNFTANLVSITGTIGAFGTHSTTPAPVDVAAKLSANGPVSIKGVGESADRETIAGSHRERARRRIAQYLAVFDQICGLSDHEGQAQRRPALHARRRKAQREQPSFHRSTHVRRSRRQHHRDQIAGSACGVAAEEFERRDRRQYPHFRLAFGSAILDRLAGLDGNRSLARARGDCAVLADRERVRRQNRRRTRLRGVRSGFGHAE